MPHVRRSFRLPTGVAAFPTSLDAAGAIADDEGAARFSSFFGIWNDNDDDDFVPSSPKATEARGGTDRSSPRGNGKVGAGDVFSTLSSARGLLPQTRELEMVKYLGANISPPVSKREETYPADVD